MRGEQWGESAGIFDDVKRRDEMEKRSGKKKAR